MAPQSSSHKPISLRTKLACKFTHALSRIKRERPTSSSFLSCSRRIKIAAYTAMAFSVGSRKSWSRALLYKLASPAGRRGLIRKRRFGVKKRKYLTVMSRADKLRRVEPGCRNMDFCSLLEETADYITCLATQVKVMRSVVDLLSA